MSNTSRIHHFIPQFYLRGFTSKNGTFKIFDKDKGQFVKDGKEFFPISYFYEIDGNNVIMGSEKDDFIELAYKKFDNMAGAILKKIILSSSSEQYNVHDEDIAVLEYFIGLMYWRVPANMESLRSLIDNKRFKDIGLKIQKDNFTLDDAEIENELKKNPNFIKFVKYLYPSFSYPETFHSNTPIHIRSLKEGGPLVCSDNPIICKNPDTFNIYTDDLIFPLNGTRVFIRGNSLREYRKNEFSGFVKIEMDMLIYKQAIKYVSCTDERYLYELDRLFNKDYGNLAKLRESVMKGLINYPAD